MEITEVRIKLVESSEDRLRGFCSVTFDDCFVVRDLKIIEGNNGPFVAMPSRKLTSNCPKCRSKNHLRANYCNNCGTRLKTGGVATDPSGRAKLYADIAHPVNADCREMIQKRVVEELEREVELSQQPGYQSRYDEDYELISPTPSKPRTEKPRKDTAQPRADRSSETPPKPHRKSGKSSDAKNPGSDEPGFGKGILD